MITYKINLNSSKQHIIHVCLTVTQSLKQGQNFWLPTWIPGSYMVRDFARNVTHIEAWQGKQKIRLLKTTSSRWRLEEPVKHLEVNYSIYAWDLSVRSAHFDREHCFFNGSSVFLAVEGLEHQPHHVELNAPTALAQKKWHVATSMPQHQCDKLGFGQYVNQNYAELIDHPVEIAQTIGVCFNVQQIKHEMVFSEAPEGVDLNKIAEDVAKICLYQCEFFADQKPPFGSYLFLIFVQKKGFGGLEHRASTALHCSYSDLPLIGEDPKVKSKDYQAFLALCSHEYFHSWNVKRIKPALFKPYDLQHQINTELLWFFEGVTSYYDELFLLRSGTISNEEYLEMLAKNITRYMKGRGRLNQSIAESSFDAWTKFYKQDENAPNSIVSYYVKGGLIAFCLDFEIRKTTANQSNLDDLMRKLWEKYGKSSRGVGEKDIQKMAEKLVGESMDEFFQHHIYSTKELALKSLFDKIGVEYRLSSPKNQLEKGGFVDKIETRGIVSSLAITHRPSDGGVEIISILDGGSASMAGLSNKDIIIAIDGIRVSSAEIDSSVAKHPVGKTVEINYFRRDRLHKLSCKLTEADKSICHLAFEEGNPNQEFINWIG